jgi:hypothetical protein
MLAPLDDPDEISSYHPSNPTSPPSRSPVPRISATPTMLVSLDRSGGDAMQTIKAGIWSWQRIAILVVAVLELFN